MGSRIDSHNRWFSFADVCGWVGLFVLVSGGLSLRWVLGSKGALIELRQWGLFFVPLAVVVLFTNFAFWETSLGRFYRFVSQLNFTDRAAYLSLSSIGMLHACAMTARHFSFNSEWDLAIYANACANRFHSSLRNHTTLLADHFEPVLALFMPLCETWDPASVLLAGHAAVWTLGSIAIYKLGLHLKLSRILSLAAGFLYLNLSRLQTVSYYDFHPYALALGTIPWIMLFLLTRRWGWFAILCIVHLTLKETTSLFVCGLGVWVALNKNHRKIGIALAITGTFWFLLVMQIIYPHFRQGQESEYFAKYYGYLGNSMSAVVLSILSRPWILATEVLSWNKVLYVLKVTAPFLFFPLCRPSLLLPVAGAFAVSLLSNVKVMYSGSFHYEAEIYAWFFVGCLYEFSKGSGMPVIQPVFDWIARKSKWNTKTRPTYWITIIWICSCLLFFSDRSPLGRFHDYAPTKSHVELAAKLRAFSAEFSSLKVATVERLVAHLASIRELTMLPEHDKAEVIIIAYPQGPRLWIQSFETIESTYAPEWNAAYKLHYPVAHDRDFRVWQR
jgi:uncharacterized membrane protein